MISHVMSKYVEPWVLDKPISYARVAVPARMSRVQLAPVRLERCDGDVTIHPPSLSIALWKTRQP
jgi:hypothetical protein